MLAIASGYSAIQEGGCLLHKKKEKCRDKRMLGLLPQYSLVIVLVDYLFEACDLSPRFWMRMTSRRPGIGKKTGRGGCVHVLRLSDRFARKQGEEEGAVLNHNRRGLPILTDDHAADCRRHPRKRTSSVRRVMESPGAGPTGWVFSSPRSADKGEEPHLPAGNKRNGVWRRRRGNG